MMTRNAIICRHFVILFLGKELEWWWAVTIFVVITRAYFRIWRGRQVAFIIFFHNCKNKKRMMTSNAIVHRHFFSWKLTKTTMNNVIVTCTSFEACRRRRAAFIVFVHNCKKNKKKWWQAMRLLVVILLFLHNHRRTLTSSYIVHCHCFMHVRTHKNDDKQLRYSLLFFITCNL